MNTRFIKLAGKINDDRPAEISNTIINYVKKKKLKKNILILGITYKKNSDDIRESPLLKIHNLLRKNISNKVFVCDPMISNFAKKTLKNIKLVNLKQIRNKQFYQSFDICLIGSNHDIFNYNEIAKNYKIIFDSRDSFKKLQKNISLI